MYIKLGSNLPSYGWLLLNEGLRMTFTQWRVVRGITSHDNQKCETILNERWCARWNSHSITRRSVRLNSMNGGVQVYITQPWEVWDYTQWMVVCESNITWQFEVWDYTQKNVCCEIGGHEGWLGLALAGIAVSWLHECCMACDLGGKPEHQTWRFSVTAIDSSSVFCDEWLFMCAWFYAFVDSVVADRSVLAAWMLHGTCLLQLDIRKRIGEVASMIKAAIVIC